ncbi:MAG: ARMT1-like domain-containing protein [Candidatus Auribacterota bacterium]|jgi:uncharacterized protein with ATP-grasp and redox domains|nr:ARMT1-like domain-containing protein [Candidatus Auribacterota bacterium]
MKIYLDCIPCFLRQTIESARLTTDDELVHESITREVLRLTAEMDMDQSPPAIGQQIHRLIRSLAGNDDPYRTLKEKYNIMAMRLYSELAKKVRESINPIESAIRLAIAGNIIDLGVKTSLNESEVEDIIRKSLYQAFDNTDFDEFCGEIDKARDILYLADNAGEIVFDRLLIELLPLEKITVVVKGYPVINDATMQDAEFVGLTAITDVIDNGSDAPGTILETCSQRFQARFEQADLIIAKGQGNYETLSNSSKKIFFILKTKCPVIAKDLSCDIGTMVLRKGRF